MIQLNKQTKKPLRAVGTQQNLLNPIRISIKNLSKYNTHLSNIAKIPLDTEDKIKASVVTPIQNELQVLGCAERKGLETKIIRIRNEKLKLELLIQAVNAYI